MSWVVRRLAAAGVLLAIIALAGFPARAASPEGVMQLSPTVSYELIGRWDADQLNAILTSKTPAFFGVSVTYTPARNAVRLYRVTYGSVVPEQGNRPIIATGLLAIPDTGALSFPLLSYQHGTVYGKKQVPSFPDQSPETQIALAQFAGQGYVVIGADYFGMGETSEPEGYLVKASHQQATYDMLIASRAVLAQMKIATPKLFLGGWSQGGFVTMAMLEKLEETGVSVDGAATASGPFDGYMTMSGFLDFPRPNDADWISTLFILTAFSFENYYGVPGLARSLINDEYYELCRKAYAREPYDAALIPTDLRTLIRAEYFDARFFRASAYGRILLNQTQAYRWIIRSPVRNYYGEADEAITPGLGQLAMTYQRAIGAGNMQVEAISTGPTSHRGTYATAVPLWKVWFDGKQ
ncbi:alpha/beta hydrolase family protein [Ancylobacter radicis]|uniref:Prolyl oligopeptidase family serine peptidase n=1 Tax=Ancylobacter radicis TaxID=2836179 RepID=A0ABS5RAU5_9HYPH|nr:prolyl oligopeptidase family serine peptidase [Ancylobacter radicis]MBS9478415.1 prolyl oligopeptidase family serine peptidase [Ancylobacter radicis]